MAFPTQDANHVAEALAFLTDHYKNQPNIKGVISGSVASIQALETAFWQIITSFLLSNSPVGDQLNSIGGLVGCPRLGMNDADYLAAVLLQIRVNRSQGLAEDIIDVATLALRGASLPYYVEPSQPSTHFPGTVAPVVQGAAYSVDCYNLASPNIVADLLSDTRSVGTYGVLHYTTWAKTTVTFTLGSKYTSKPGTGGWGSHYTGTVGGVLGAGSVT